MKNNVICIWINRIRQTAAHGLKVTKPAQKKIYSKQIISICNTIMDILKYPRDSVNLRRWYAVRHKNIMFFIHWIEDIRKYSLKANDILGISEDQVQNIDGNLQIIESSCDMMLDIFECFWGFTLER